MKIGKLEGTPEEISNALIDNGLNFADFLEKPEKVVKSKWFLFPSIIVGGSLILLVLKIPVFIIIDKVLFLLGCGGCIWLSIVVQIRFKNVLATLIAIIGTFLLMMISIGLITPVEIIQNLKDLKK